MASKKIIGVCQYHLCQKETVLNNCLHCKKNFCHLHIKPTKPSFTSLDDDDSYKELRSHPCPEYPEFLKAEEKLKTEKYLKALDNVSSRKRKVADVPGSILADDSAEFFESKAEAPNYKPSILDKLKRAIKRILNIK